MTGGAGSQTLIRQLLEFVDAAHGHRLAVADQHTRDKKMKEAVVAKAEADTYYRMGEMLREIEETGQIPEQWEADAGSGAYREFSAAYRRCQDSVSEAREEQVAEQGRGWE